MPSVLLPSDFVLIDTDGAYNPSSHVLTLDATQTGITIHKSSGVNYEYYTYISNSRLRIGRRIYECPSVT